MHPDAALTPPFPPLDGRAGAFPEARFLWGGGLTVLLTGEGTSSSWMGDLALTRWTGDPIEASEGAYLYIRDPETGLLHPIGRRPAGPLPDSFRSFWAPGVFGVRRKDGGIESSMEVCVAPGSPVEIRRIALANRSSRARTLEVCSYSEVVLHRRADHEAHPAFSKLFVRTEALPREGALLANRRPRGAAERHPWMFHALLGPGRIEFETDRARFLGRGGSLSSPLALESGAPFSATAGAVLDPAFAIRRSVRIEPGESASFRLLQGVAPTREEALRALHAWNREEDAERAFHDARARASEALSALGIDEGRAEYYQSLAGAVLYGHPGLRAPETIERCRDGVSALRSHGMRPDRPTVVLHAESSAGLALFPETLRMHRYWEALGLPIRLVVLAEDATTLPLPSEGANPAAASVLELRSVPDDLLSAIDASARMVVADSLPDLARLARALPHPNETNAPRTTPRNPPPARETGAARGARDEEELLYFNGHGGFSREGDAYVIRLRHQEQAGPARPPLPWVNVVANERFGFLVSETGSATTWSGNSREHRLTPWSNDPVLDPCHEALYIRDEETGTFWSPLPSPAPADASYEMRHRFGSSVCRHASNGLEQETLLFVPRGDPVKIVRVRIANRGDRPRRVSVVSYRKLVLGVLPEESGRTVIVERDTAQRAVFARNPFAGDFAGGVVFSSAEAEGAPGPARVVLDRLAFLGPRGDAGRPAALRMDGPIDAAAGAGGDACVAEQVFLEIAPGGTASSVFLFGEGADREEACSLLARYRKRGAVEEAFEDVERFWSRIRSGVRVETPAPAIDLMVNGWLVYQTLACRLLARSAFYQSGGAFGYRDQLQDACALVYASPEITRAQILVHAAHQFVEGDVLHWWHPPVSRGIRTRFADDRLWLPHATAFYVQTTGDRRILDERVPFLEARRLAEGEDEAFAAPEESDEIADLYEHCCRAIDESLETGAHGLPLFGTGDWNDGMNRVGRLGRGESVWMGQFLYAVLGEFSPFCELRSDPARARRYREARERLRDALEEFAWDGDWYRRGYYDDGTPLGSSSGDECRIDALSQAWAVLSGAAPRERAERALDAVERHLISEQEGLIRLLTPPFDRTPHDPGYIKGYVPGVRENGGQYTHAALWVVRAEAELGRNDRAARLLEMLGPVGRSSTPDRAAVYKVEPYVVAADVYGEPPHVGRGGWTWYTGSSGWMYRVAIESVLGFRIEEGKFVRVRPCIPDDWPRCRVEYRVPGEETLYRIEIENPSGKAGAVAAALLDGAPVPVEGGSARVPLLHDGAVHTVVVTLGG
jgi:cyclic beta-1,2-glucan synthetase